MGKNWWRAETGIFFALWFVFLQLGSVQFLTDPGPYWSTVIGRRILAEGRVPSAEDFSCTLRGQPWNSHQWLTQCAFALLDRLGGLDGLVLGAATLLAVLFTWVAHRLLRAGLHWLPTALILMLTILASRYHLLARPHLTTIALLGWTVGRLTDFESARISWRGLLWLLPAFVLWTNLHGGALGGLSSVALVVFGWLVGYAATRKFGWGLNSPLQDNRQALGILAILIACLLATLVNPYGWELPLDWVRLMGSPVIAGYINEHQPLDWLNPFQLPIVFFGLVYLWVLLNLHSWRQLRISWLLPLVWFVLSVQRVRHCTLFAISAAVVLADVLPHTRAAAALARLPSWLFQPPTEPTDAPRRSWGRTVQPYVLPAIAVVLAFVSQSMHWPVPLVGRGLAVQDHNLAPLDMRAPLEQYGHPGQPIFNDLAYGGFLIYYTPLSVFLDDRCELYGDDFLKDYFESNREYHRYFYDTEAKQPRPVTAAGIAQLPDHIARWEQQYGTQLDLALVMKDSGFWYYLAHSPDKWKKLAETQRKNFRHQAVLYQRVNRQ
ncbi:MAG: hypothetical protein JNM56_40835 [Planctomycetia bacterium]|nr:hypothetical protein [Planctomycetia bacterium]